MGDSAANAAPEPRARDSQAVNPPQPASCTSRSGATRTCIRCI